MVKPLPNSKSLEEFVKGFDAHVEPSQRRFKRLTNDFSSDWLKEDLPNGDFKISHYIEEVEGVAIHIPIYKLNDFLSSIPQYHYKEMEIRMSVPAVKKAYEQYRLLLKMCGGEFDAGY